MPFMHHLDELRKRLVLVVVVLLVLIVVMYAFSEPIYRFITQPVADLVGDTVISIKVFEPMMLRFKLGTFGAVLVASPLIIWQALAFFLPALKERERKWVLPTFFAMLVLFFGGAAFCYKLILPTAFEWLIAQAGGILTYMPLGSDLITSIMWFLFGFGIAFQTPVIVFYLVFFGVVPYKTLRENWRIVWVVIVIVAAMATPDWSPVSMGALSAAMIVLYEISMLLVRILLRKKIERQSAELEEA